MHDFEDSSQWLFDHEGLRRLAEAEARGYANGVEEAARICADPATPNSILVRYPGTICRELAARIRALLEPK